MNYEEIIGKTLSRNVLKKFEENTRENVDDVLINRYIDLFEMDCLQLAVECKCNDFMSTSIVQNFLDNTWKGTRYDANSSPTILSMIFITNLQLKLKG